MTAPEDPLGRALRGLADQVEQADLYGAALRRSRGLAHRRAAAGTVSALTVLGLVCGGLWYLDPPGRGGTPGGSAVARSADRLPAPGLPEQTSVSASPRSTTTTTQPTPTHDPQVAPGGTAVPRSRSLADLPGEVFYDRPGESPEVVRLDGDGSTDTVLTAPHSAIGVSPDGTRIAYVHDGTLLVAQTDGSGSPEQPYDGSVSDQQVPAWSPDGHKLLIDAADPSVLDVSDGSLRPLPGSLEGKNFQWSGDGSKVVYATSECRLKVAELSAEAPTVTVPEVGDPADPDAAETCRPVSVDETGRRVAVPLQSADDGGRAVANAVVDTATGVTDELPVRGVVIGIVFASDGDLLVRTSHQGSTTLSLFSPGNVLLMQAHEPGKLRDLDLIAYTH